MLPVCQLCDSPEQILQHPGAGTEPEGMCAPSRDSMRQKAEKQGVWWTGRAGAWFLWSLKLYQFGSFKKRICNCECKLITKSFMSVKDYNIEASLFYSISASVCKGLA